MPRFGPLSSAPDGVAVGDHAAKHLLLTPEQVRYHGAAGRARDFGWADVERISIDLPCSRFRATAAVSGALMIATSLLSMQVIDDLPEDGTAIVRSDGSDHPLSLTRHHVGGYWRRSVQATQRLLDRLVADPPSRELLRHPDDLIRTVIASTR